MRTLSEGFGFENAITTLASAEPRRDTKPQTVKQTPEIERVPLDELEYAYIKHPITFNAINKAVQSIMSAGWKLVSDDEAALKVFQDFIESVALSRRIFNFNFWICNKVIKLIIR